MPPFNFVCLLSAVLFWASSATIIAMVVQRQKDAQNEFTREEYTSLDPSVIEARWIFREDEKTLFYASGFLNGIFWIVFCIPICEMAWILTRGGSRAVGASVGIGLFAVGGALTEWISHLFWVGTTTTSLLLSAEFNLDDWLRDDIATLLEIDGSDGLGWRTLEINHVATSGMIWIVGSFEWLALTGLFTLTFVSVYGWRKEDETSFSPRWNAMGLFIGLLCIIEFVFEILRFEGVKWTGPFIVLYAIINRIILIPAWIISLGYQLPLARRKALEGTDLANAASDLSLTEVVPMTTPTNNGNSGRQSDFSIDDDGPAVPARSSPPKEAFAAAPPMMMAEEGTSSSSSPFPVSPEAVENGNGHGHKE
mmetsp:Transcript_16828/g.40735  ORF Transcript_16828/g.40735 Transcript_16828/m.40735 type:complete len:366 (-) Transcript_16828:1233-2330(-)